MTAKPLFKNKSLVKHIASNTYYIVTETPAKCRLESSNSPAYAYTDLKNERLWVRSQIEMEDGRFEPCTVIDGIDNNADFHISTDYQASSKVRGYMQDMLSKWLSGVQILVDMDEEWGDDRYEPCKPFDGSQESVIQFLFLTKDRSCKISGALK